MGSCCLQNSVGLYISGALYGYTLLIKQDKRQSEEQLNAQLTRAQQELEASKSQVRGSQDSWRKDQSSAPTAKF